MLTEQEKQDLAMFQTLSDEALLQLTPEDIAYLESLELKSAESAPQQQEQMQRSGSDFASFHPNYKSMSQGEAQGYLQDLVGEAKRSLKSIFKGNFEALEQGLAEGRKPVNVNDEQRQFIQTVMALNAGDEQTLNSNLAQLKAQGNKFVPFLEERLGKKMWGRDYTEQGELKQKGLLDQAVQMAFPNLSLRTKDEDSEVGLFGKAVAGAQDVFTSIPRVLTGVVSKFGAGGDDVSLFDAIGRPEAFSSGGERMADFVGSGAGSGLALKSIGKLAGKIDPIAQGVAKAQGTKAGRVIFGEPSEKMRDVVWETFEDPALRMTRGQAVRQGASQGLERGLRESARDMALPTAFTATEQEKYGGGGDVALFDALLGGAIGGTLGAGIGAGKRALSSTKTARGIEASGDYATVDRLKEASKNEPLTMADQGVEQLQDIGKAGESIKKKLGKEREEIISFLPETISEDATTNLRNIVNDDIENGITLLENETPVYLKDLLIEESFKLRSNLMRAKNHKEMAKAMLDENTRLARIADKITDPDKKYLYNSLRQTLKSAEGRGIIENDARQYITDQDILDNLGGLSLNRAQFAELYSAFDPIEEALKSPEKGASFLSKQARERIDPLRKAGVGVQLDNIKQLQKVLAKYGYKDLDVDYLTPAVVREIRSKMRGSEGTAFENLLKSIQPKSLQIGKAIAEPTAKGSFRQYPQMEKGADSPDNVEMIPFNADAELLMQGGSGKVKLREPTYKAKSVKELR